jgi:hypothetical protein
MAFLGKSSLEQALDGDVVEDKDDWEHRVITGVV